MSVMAEYRVNLDIYNGPLDLLLYLIRREEVDIHDIPIARITEQYVSYVEMLHALDPNLAGEFLVLAATLMEIKSRMLLPRGEAEDGEDEDLQIDPRADLVRQLLQYKVFKDAAGDLHAAAEWQALKFPRRPAESQSEDDRNVDLDEVQIWDLFDAFRGILEAIGQRPTNHEVIYDDTPVELHAEDILDRLERDGALSFRQLFEGRTERSEIVGLFLALLELIRLQKIFVQQGKTFGEIDVHINPNPPEERSLHHLFADSHVPDSQEDSQEADAPSCSTGAYESDREDESDDEDDGFLAGT